MRLPQRFKRVPTEDPTTELRDYPLQDTMDTKAHEAGGFDHKGLSKDTETAYAAGAWNNPRQDTIDPENSNPRLSKHENQHGGSGGHHFRRFANTFIYGWRAGLFRSLFLCLVAFIVNVAIYAWLYSAFKTKAGTATCMTGKCGHIRGANTAIHAALNVVSTCVLGASTYALQGLTAPTRKEVDKAHAKGKWLEIGTASLRNLLYVRKLNILFWALLAITSLPFHLFFNAVFFMTSQTNQYSVAVVEQSYFNDTTFTPSANNSSPNLFDQWVITKDECEGQPCTYDVRNISTVVDMLQDVRNTQAHSFVRMDPLECISNYTQGFMRDYSDVVVVSSRSNASSPVLYTRYPERAISLDKTHSNPDPFHWVCHDLFPTNNSQVDRCSLKLAKERTDSGKNWTVYGGNPVEYCLARVAPDICELQFNLYLMLGVVVFGVVKVITLCVMVFRSSGHCLRTLGDAIVSFLEDPDPATKDMCLVSSKQIRKSGSQMTYTPQTFTGRRNRWLNSANTKEFLSSIGVGALYVLILTIALVFAVDGAKGFAWSNGLGVPNIQSLASFQNDDTGSSGIVPNLIVANIPQLGFSILYVLYTNIWSKMLVAHEFDRMTQAKKGLRVSNRPVGMQRSSRFFALPARYALPLMTCSAALHWLCSQSFFLVRINGVNAYGEIDKDDQIVRLGYSATGIVSLISLAAAILIGTLAIAFFRRLQTELGETSMSVLISAACHLKDYATEYGFEPWRQEMQWGDVSVGDANQDVRHCAFSPGLVRRPVVGQAYS